MVAEIQGKQSEFIISRVQVYDLRFRTDKGIGVGSTLGYIRKNYKIDSIDFGEGSLYAWVKQIGMSFALDY